MGYKVNAAITALLLFTVFVFQRQRRRDKIVRQRGCEPLVKLQPLEPLSGLDFHVAIYTDIPTLYHHHQRYGDSFQVNSLLSTPTVNTIAPHNIRVINTSGREWGIQAMRLSGMEDFCGQGFLTVDGDIWQRSRKLLKPSFAKENLENLGPISREVDIFLDHLPKDGTTVDLQPLLYVMFLNTSLHFLIGVSSDEESRDAPHSSEEFVNAFHDALFLTLIRVLLGPAWKFVPQADYLKACGTAHAFLDFYVNQARIKMTSKTHLSDRKRKRSLVEGLSSQTDEKVYIRDQILQGMMASQETTSALLGNTFLLLSRHPTYWQQIRAEVLKKGNGLLSFDGLLASKIVQNVLLESLRLYPIFPVMARVALCDTTLPVGGGPNHDAPIFVPKGSMAVMSYYALHRDPRVYGDEVEAFKPERWNTINPGPWEFMGFGGGNRACLGQQKALVEAAYVLVRVAAWFQKLECRDDQEWQGELLMTCKSKNGCKVALYSA